MLPAVLCAIVALTLSGGAVLELATKWPRRRLGAATARYTSLAAIGVLVFLAIGSVLIEYPHLPHVDIGAPPPTGWYLQRALLASVTWARLTSQDFLLSTMFWGVFGWSDRILPDSVVSACVALTLAGAVHLLWRLRGDPERVGRLIVFSVGAWLSFVGYAYTTFRASPDLNARYLVGLYLSILAIIWTGFALRPVRRSSELHFVAPMLLHAGIIWFIYSSYF